MGVPKWVLGMDPNIRLGTSSHTLSPVSLDAMLTDATYQGRMAHTWRRELQA